MTKAKKIILILSVIAMMAIVGIISWSYGFRQGINAGQFTSSMAEMMLANKHMEDQFENASCDGVRQSINEYLQAIEDNKNADGGTSYYSELMIGHLRLARIEEHLGNIVEKERRIALAKQACLNRKWKDCSEETITIFSKKIEDKYPIACLKDKK